MSIPIMPVAPDECFSYRNERAFPFCPGCGHPMILNHLNNALLKLSRNPRRVVLVTDIGCQGLSDQYFTTHAFHGLHGRSIAYATGIKLADPTLTVIVIMGDGGTGIGGAHLLNAARRNIGITVLVFNNFNFGMTGGEHSVTTPSGGKTATTRGGNIERPLDICATVGVNGAGYVWRGTSFDKDLPDRITDAVESESFALLDIWELCTAYYVPNNQFSRKALDAKSEELGMPYGLLYREDRAEFSQAMRTLAADVAGEPALPPRSLPAVFSSALNREFSLVLAGSAGGKVLSTARTVCEAAILSGLWVSQKDDYPVTVQTGHSISEIVLSPREILYSSVDRPDALVIISKDGLAQAGKHLAALTEQSWLFVTPEFADLSTRAQKIVIDPAAAGARVDKKSLALLLTAAALRHLGVLNDDALPEAIRQGQRGEIAEQNLAAIEQAVALALALPPPGDTL